MAARNDPAIAAIAAAKSKAGEKKPRTAQRTEMAQNREREQRRERRNTSSFALCGKKMMNYILVTIAFFLYPFFFSLQLTCSSGVYRQPCITVGSSRNSGSHR
jgi:hypothetical protein